MYSVKIGNSGTFIQVSSCILVKNSNLFTIFNYFGLNRCACHASPV